MGFVPRSAEGASAFVARLQAAVAAQPGYRTLNVTQQVLVARIADHVIPRTDTPGALDVKVPQLIDLLLTEWYDSSERDAMLANIVAIDQRARDLGVASFTALSEKDQVALLTDLDRDRAAPASAAAGFRALKSLTVFGYFTSELVTKDILQVRMVFPRYQGDAPVSA